MPIEIEAKMKVAEHGNIRARLNQLGAKPKSAVLETNTFFDTPDRSLFSQNKGLRVRYMRGLKETSEKTVITFKGPQRMGPLKSRPEFEMTVTNPIEAVSFLEAMGYIRTLTFQKKRESWRLGECTVELDELPHLGLFVEIEGPDEHVVFEAREALGLGEEPVIKTAYTSLLAVYMKDHGITEQVITFVTPGQSHGGMSLA